MISTMFNDVENTRITDEQFYKICFMNRDAILERTAKGDLRIMTPAGGETSRHNLEILLDLGGWNRQTKLGVVFESSAGFILPSGAILSPDAAWIPLDKWSSLTQEQRTKFLPLCPDFVIELRSPSDTLKPLQEKMREYLDNGTRLAWLINPQNRQVEIYRFTQEVEVLDNPSTLSGEEVLPGFVLNLGSIW